MIKRNDHQVFYLCIWRSCRGCGLGELVDSGVLFLREQVRNLRVQEFFRELVVGVTALRDFAGSIIVKILHSVEGEDVPQVCSNLEIILQCLRLLTLSILTLLSLYLLAHLSCLLICKYFLSCDWYLLGC